MKKRVFGASGIVEREREKNECDGSSNFRPTRSLQQQQQQQQQQHEEEVLFTSVQIEQQQQGSSSFINQWFDRIASRHVTLLLRC